MASTKERAIKQVGYVAITTLVFLAFNWVNELLFIQFEQSNGINWVFIPAGIRLLATLLFGFAGFVGLLLASFYLNFHHFVFPDAFRALSGAMAGAGGPYLAYLFAKHWFDLQPRLGGLTVQRLLFTGVLCGLMSPVFHHALLWVQTGLVDWLALTAMIVGDIVGILIVLSLAKGLLALSDRFGPAARIKTRWTPRGPSDPYDP
ncbi:hypothetical protein [Massilia litorea]|uniref:MASE1 domain-containing protein n=1 Tax=Massilia litorea TaxID=2769491 RepID=A0A7L9U2D2_9BURK|nr:hypothetical protein [Massilia litorea]QOL49128.1 hypothetical protein LPB04_19720 [Massilia litorea]